MRLPPVPTAEKLLAQAATRTPGEASVYVNSRLAEVVKGFPDFDKLDPFTAAMAGTVLNRDKLKQSLGRLHGVQKTIRTLAHLKSKAEFLGRLKSILKRLSANLKLLAEAKAFLKRIPDPTAHYTTCIAGFPNVGKSTLLKALTGAHVEIANYEFTTRSLNYGSTEIHHLPVQFVDTPGTLAREKTNPIEKQVDLALRHLADAVVFVYDPTREDDESQEKLWKQLERMDCPKAMYASKQDLVNKLPPFAGKTPVFTKPAEVLDWIRPAVVALAKER